MSIPIPAGMEQAPVTWTLGHTTGTEALRGARGLVRFEPTAVAVAYPDVTVLPATVTARVSAGVMDSVDLTVNDPELWNWRVVPELGVAWTPFHIDVPVEGVDLATAVVVPGVGPIRAVTGPPGTTAWADLTGKPATYPPAPHTHPIADVTGLQAIIDRLGYDSGWRALCRWSGGAVTEGELPTGLAPRGNVTGGVFVRRYPTTVAVAVVEANVTAVNPRINLPSGFRGSTGVPYPAVPIYYRDANLDAKIANAEFGSGFVCYRDVPAGATLSAAGTGGYGVMTTVPSEDSLPTSLPGTPA